MHSQIKIRCRAVIIHEGKLLVVRHSNGNTFHALPGGHLDFGEDPKECIRRELIEELGVAPEIGRLLYVYTFIDKEGRQSVEFFFEITNGEAYLTHTEMEKTHAHEIAETTLISIDTDVEILPKEIGEDFRTGNILADVPRFIKG